VKHDHHMITACLGSAILQGHYLPSH